MEVEQVEHVWLFGGVYVVKPDCFDIRPGVCVRGEKERERGHCGFILGPASVWSKRGSGEPMVLEEQGAMEHDGN